MPYIVLSDGTKIQYDTLAEMIKALRPDLRGTHIFQQLQGLGLLEKFQSGTTPHSLPYSFSDYEKESSLELPDRLRKMDYDEEDLERSNPYNTWVYEA